MHVKLNEGLEVLGSDDQSETNSQYCGVFEGSSVRSVALPQTLKAIKSGAFKSCKNLNTVTLPPLVESLDEACFQDSGLQSVFIPRNVKTMGKNTFYKCEALKSVIFLDNALLQELPEKSFAKTAVQNITLPSGLRVVGSGAFQSCLALKRVQLNDGLETLGENCFMNTGLAGVDVPRSVREVGDGAFWKCKGLAHANIPRDGGLRRIGLRAFSETALESFQAPDGLAELAQSAFSKCALLRRAVLNSGLRALGTQDYMDGGKWYCGAFEDSGLREVVFPDTLQVIEYGTFRGCAELCEVRLPGGLLAIGDGAFY